MAIEDKKLVYESIKDQLDQQISSVDSFATRSGLVLATCGVIFAGYLQLFASPLWLEKCDSILFLFEILAIIISGVFAFLSLVHGSEEEYWRYDPDPEKIYRLLHDQKQYDITDEVMRSMIAAFKHNQKLFKKKYRFLKLARYCLYVSGSIFIIHLLFFFF